MTKRLHKPIMVNLSTPTSFSDKPNPKNKNTEPEKAESRLRKRDVREECSS